MRHWPAVMLQVAQADEALHMPAQVVSFGWHAQRQL
jgi:hypothetical protein